VELQASVRESYAIWVHAIFATGLHIDFYEHTNNHGSWAKNFIVPVDTVSHYSSQAVVTFEIIHGKRYAKSFVVFDVIR
jgi:hypothetical protein